MDKSVKDDSSMKNFGLTEAEFTELYDKLISGDELFFETTFMTHFKPAMKYLMNTHGAIHDDAYDIVMNVLIEFRKRVIDGKVKYGNLKFMFTQMCVQRYKRDKGKKLDTEHYAYLNQYEDHVIDEEAFTLLDNAMNKIGEQCRQIIEDVYYGKIAYKVLSEKYKVTAANLRKQKERCLTKLKMNLRQSLNRIK